MHRDAGRLVLIGVLGLGAKRGPTLLEVRREFLISGLAVEIVHLVGIGLEIVEFKLLRLDEEVDQLVALSPHATTGPHVFKAGIFVVLVQPVFSPRDCSPCLPPAAACSCPAFRRARAKPGNLKKRWREVEVQDHLIGLRSGLYAAGIADDHRNSNGRLVHQALVVEMVFAEKEAVIGAEQDMPYC